MARFRFRSLLISILCLGLPWSVSAAVYWVSTASTGLQDNNPCVNSATPLDATARRTITNGWNCLSPGDTLMVRGGTYAGFHLNNGRGGNGAYKTLKPAPGETVILDAALTSHIGQGVISFWGLAANWVTIDGSGGTLKITDSVTGPPDHGLLQPASWPCQNLWSNINQNGCNGGPSGACNGCTPATDPGANMSCAQSIYDFIIARRRGIDFDQFSSTDRPHHLRILNVELTRLGQFAIWGAADDVEVGNSHIHNNDLYGTYISGGYRLRIYNNHVHDNRSVGLRFGHDGNPGDAIIGKVVNSTIENNIIHDNYGRIFHVSGSAGASDLDTGGYGLICYGCANNVIKNNLLYKNAWNDRWGNACNIWGLWVMDRLTGANQVFNNTIVGHDTTTATGASGFENAAFGPQNTAVRNNILYQNKDNVIPGTATVFGTNLCNNADTGCSIPNANPLFSQPLAGDYKIGSASSPAVGAGVSLFGVPTDLEGTTRSSTPTVGAYEFVAAPPPQPDPELLLAYWALDAGSLTSAIDSSGNGHTGTLDSAAWASPGIIGTSAFAPTGTQEITIPSAPDLSITTSCSLNLWLNMTTTDVTGCAPFSNREGCALYISPLGIPECWVKSTASWTNAHGPSSVLTGTNRMVTCTYDSTEPGSGIRLSVDDAQVAFTPLTGAIDYSQSAGAIRIGRDGAAFGGYQCRGVIDEVRLYQGRLSDAGRHNLFNAAVPQPGMSVPHTATYVADTTEGVQLGATDADVSAVLTAPMGLRWAIHKADPGSLTEFLPTYCRTNTGAGFGAWTAVGNTLGSLGVRYYADSVVSTGQATTRLLPLDGFTGIPGIFVESPVDLNAVDGYDAVQRLTIAQGQHAELQAQLAFGVPLVAGNTVQCKLHRENAEEFCPTCYTTKTITLQNLQPPTAVRLGITSSGGTYQ